MKNSYIFQLIIGVITSVCFLFGFFEYSNNYREISPIGYSNIVKMLDENPSDNSFKGLVNLAFSNDWISVREFRLILETYNLSYGTLVSNQDPETGSNYFKQLINDRLVDDFTKG